MLFGKPEPWWQERQGLYTAAEIAQQPDTWEHTIRQLESEKDDLAEFIDCALAETDSQIIFCGAGTSEFIGNTIYPFLDRQLKLEVKSVPSTDLTCAPDYYVDPDKKLLLVSFGRSGDSPESVASVQAANALSQNVSHLLITCNKDGALSQYAEAHECCYALNLDPRTHDKSFAMTSSFSNMMLAALLALDQSGLAELAGSIPAQTEAFMAASHEAISSLVNDFDFNRIVYLGSNVLKGAAQESALKMCELTAGQVDTIFDTFMGFRHGPKSVINDETLIVLYFSDDPYTRQYEMDVLKEIAGQKKGDRIAALSSSYDPEIAALSDYYFTLNNEEVTPQPLLALEYIPFAQLLALYKSLASGCTPDNPCPSGEVNRVVKGVTIYPLPKSR